MYSMIAAYLAAFSSGDDEQTQRTEHVSTVGTVPQTAVYGLSSETISKVSNVAQKESEHDVQQMIGGWLAIDSPFISIY